MSTIDSDGPDMPGDSRLRDGQLQLARLHRHMRLLARLARSREAGETGCEIDTAELAACFELLAAQVQAVGEATWPARRHEAAGESATGAVPAVAADAQLGDRLLFGVTLDQVDRLDYLLDMIAAHGDVVIGAQEAELANQTLPLLGQAICDGVTAVREVLGRVQAQRLRPGPGGRSAVGEQRGVYVVGDALSVERRPSGAVLPLRLRETGAAYSQSVH